MPATTQLWPTFTDPEVHEDKRFCSNPACRQPVGRTRNGVPGQVKGACPRCGAPFCFRAPLAAGALLGEGGQFRVKGTIAHGGLGWVYGAWDRRVNRWVVLKGLIDPDDPDTRQAAVAELTALADAKHPNIVTVHTVVTHQHPLTGHDVDYIVMEYLHGESLKKLFDDHENNYLPVEQVCEFAIHVLAALGHLHDRGLLYCDISADNVIHSTDGVKLIDLGAVRRMDDQDSPIWGKKGYQDPSITEQGPSIETDIYSVGRMMAVLSVPFPGFTSDAPIPSAEDSPVFAEHPSFHHLLLRATHPDRTRRFASAAEMAEQVEGVLREVRALRENRPFPAASTLFGPELRVVGADPDTFPIGELDTAAAALALPDPQADPADPQAGLLAAISADNPAETERVLTQLADPSLEIRLRVVRLRIELRRPEADRDLKVLREEQPDDWRVDWLRGLRSLVENDVESAREQFAAVLAALPGEAAPKLALALCAQHAGAAETAAQYYGTVWRTDRSYVSAAFGLARARFALGDRAGMAAALESVPENSRYAVTAQLCAILARCRGRTDATVVADFFTAADRLGSLDLDERRYAQAATEVLRTALDWERANRPQSPGEAVCLPATLLGHPRTRQGTRDGLELAYRTLARLAPTPRERITFVDQANHYRNRSWI